MSPLAPIALALGLASMPPSDADAEAPRRPNVVFLLADDLGINDLGCYGRADHRTPHLDALARSGMRFTSAYAAQPVCSPTRAALMTGKTPVRLGITTFLPGRGDAPSQKLLQAPLTMQLPPGEVTIAERLKAAGYATACLGKWHLGGGASGPAAQGFDVVHPGRANTTPSETEGGKGEFDLTEQAEAFLEANRDRPFFLYLAHNNPHIPLAAQPERLAAASGAFNPTYAAVINTLDDAVGRVLAKLDALGLADDTLVVFTSDNGGLHVPEGDLTPATHNSPFRAGKGFVYEGGIRVPLIVRWPGRVPAGAEVGTPVITTDWTPTLLELCGLGGGGPFDGVSLAPLLRGGTIAPRPLFWHLPHYCNQGSRPSGAIRDGDWKLVEHFEDGSVELYDLARDPGETRDLAADEPERARSMRDALAAWRREVGAAGNRPNPAFDPARHRALYIDTDVSTLRPAPTAQAMRPALEAWRRGMADAPRRPAPAAAPAR